MDTSPDTPLEGGGRQGLTTQMELMTTSSNGKIFRIMALYTGNQGSPVNSPRKGQWRGVLVFSLMFAWTNGRVNNGDPGDLRRHGAYYDVIASDRRVTYVTSSPIYCKLATSVIENGPRIIVNQTLLHMFANNSRRHMIFWQPDDVHEHVYGDFGRICISRLVYGVHMYMHLEECEIYSHLFDEINYVHIKEFAVVWIADNRFKYKTP